MSTSPVPSASAGPALPVVPAIASKPLKPLALAWLLFRRDWRGGELRLLFAALLVAVAAISSVGFFVDRLSQALSQQARQLLGADLVISSDTAIDAAVLEQARAMGLAVGQTVVFPSMVEVAGRTQLASIKAVTANYPLRGQLRVAQAALPNAAGMNEKNGTSGTSGTTSGERPISVAPRPGEVWADPQLVQALALTANAEVELGEIRLRFDQTLTYEPDRGTNFVNFAPRLLMAIDDLAATRLIQPASRVTYRLLVAGEPAVVKRFEQTVALKRGQRIESLENGRPELRTTLDRAEKFLALVSLLTALISAVAIALAARQFAQRHVDGCAVMKTMGLRQSTLQGALLIELTVIGLIAGAVAVVIGWGLHFVLIRAIATFLQIELPPTTGLPIVQSMAAGLVLLLGFGAWPFLRLADVPPLRVLRRDVGVPRAQAWIAPVIATVAYTLLMFWFASDVWLATVALLGFLGAGLVFAAAAWLLVRLLSPLRSALAHTGAAPALRIALATWSSRRGVTVVQTVALSVGLMALLLLTVTRNDLLDSWRRASPADAPNRFVINIQPDQREEVARLMVDDGVKVPDLYPMIRGRLVVINGKEIRPDQYTDERAQRLIDREFNLSYGSVEPSHNKTVDGRWLDPAKPEVSVELGIMQTLNLAIGDELGFDIAGETVKARITGVRKLAWDSMKVNFFMILSPAALESRPQTWITAYHQRPVAADKRPLDNALVQRFSNLTVFDTGNIVRQVQAMLDQVIRAVQVLFVLTLIAGLVVLYAALASSRDERTREAGLMRAMGATRRQLLWAQMLELGVAGGLAGLLAAAAALAVGLVLARQVFQFEYEPQWLGLLGGLVLGAVAAMAAGGWGLRSVLQTPPVQTLRALS